VTPDEAHLFRPAGNDILVFSPMLAPRPATRIKLDGQVRGVFISRPTQLSEPHGKPLRQYPEAAVAIWVGERKGAPAYVSLYPVSSLVGKGAANGDADKTENRELPQTVARKAFYKADKLTVKWNNAGTMVRFRIVLDVTNPSACSSRTRMSTTRASRTTARRTCTSWRLTGRLTA
jgi:translation initiation factor 2A